MGISLAKCCLNWHARAWLILVWMVGVLPFQAAAQSYPNRPVKIVVPFAAGGPADNFGRFMAQRLQEAFKQPFIVENKPGAGSVIGTDFVAKSAADGYTLLMMSNAQTVNESLIPNKPYGLLKDFVGVAPINYSDLILVLNPALKPRTVAELIAYARANPGKLNYASSGSGTPYHMAGELFKNMAQVDMTHVPYKGSSGARTDILGGQVDLMFDAVTTMTDLVRGGKVIALATTGLSRSAIFTELPTLDEAGLKGFEATVWVGLMAPRGVPANVIESLNDAVRKIVTDPEVKALWAQRGAQPLVMSPADFDRYIQADVAKWSKIVSISGAKPD